MPGPRVFDLDQIQQLVPELELVFGELDVLRSRMRSLKLRINALELIWGEAVHQPDHPDHQELAQHLREMAGLQEEFERVSQRVARLGGEIKGLEPALVDFYGVRDGRLVFWCWTRGEANVEHWHHVDEGFAGRQRIER